MKNLILASDAGKMGYKQMNDAEFDGIIFFKIPLSDFEKIALLLIWVCLQHDISLIGFVQKRKLSHIQKKTSIITLST